MPKSNTPSYIKSLLAPNPKAQQGRRVWSIDLETVWLPFFTATNTTGDTAIPPDALGCPIRLAYDKDGSVKFSNAGRPVTRVAKPLADSVTLVRQNFVANLQRYAGQVAQQMKEEYGQQIKLAHSAGQPLIQHDKTELDRAIQLQLEEAMRQAQEESQEEEKEEAKAEEKELVPAG
ncbi:hypothetical protein LCGC14_1692560 [marine sediment metagenome]|uniref:Uncharacterized protein n=1 Tax=marine sediment metagenome TaxID=412755 RepID=A0A0F9HKT6_9ZZZZ